ncbi:glutamyl-tRNA reductase [Opitutaceae bacterium TAV1]|nr:glutamyl-tRNA reductase [Opitutaceae bacterium TAV1]
MSNPGPTAGDSRGDVQLFHLGASHRRAPLDLRERLALDASAQETLRLALATRTPGLSGPVILNTCNRIEFYGVASPAAIDALETTFCELRNLPREEFAAIRDLSRGPDALRHLIEVASGLESQMLGENEIFGQVKTAYAAAQIAGSTGPVLNRVFQKTFQAAKHVRSSTAITEGQVSVANVAVELAQNIFGKLSASRVLLLGAGDIGEKTAKAFQSRGAASLTVCSRTLERAMELASTLDATAMPFEHFTHHLGQFDIAVCSTSAPDAVVTAGAVAAAMRTRPAQPLFFIDLALPRDVEPAVAGLENVFVYNLDDLARIAEKNRAAREAEVARARALAAARADALWRHVHALLTR